MRKIWRIFRTDMAASRSNAIAMVVVVGMIIIPSLYAWFNIAGSWDPYGATSNLKVAVANSDEGYTSDIMPVSLNIGEKVTSALRANDGLDWVFTNEDDAIDGVSGGRYYAAIVIPKEFSTDMMTVAGEDSHHAKLIYYSNEKENSIASIVTSKGADTIRKQVDETFAKTVATVGVGAMSQVNSYMSSDQLVSFANTLNSSLGTGITDVRTAASRLSAYSQLLGTTSSVLDGTSGLLGNVGGTAANLREVLDNSSKDVGNLDSTITGTTETINNALASSSLGVDDIDAAVDKAFNLADTESAQAAEDMRTLGDKVMMQIRLLYMFQDNLVELRDGLPTTEQPLVDSLIAHVKGSITNLTELSQRLFDGADALEAAASDTTQQRADIKDSIAKSKESIDGVKVDYENGLRAKANDLAWSIGTVSGSADSVTSQLTTTVNQLSGVSGEASSSLGNVRLTLDNAAASLLASANKLDDVRTRISQAASSGDVDQIKQIIGTDSETLATFLASPVGTDRVAVFPVENTGSAMMPFYTTLCLWVGAIVLVAMIKVVISKREEDSVGGLKPHEAYFGRLGVFVVLALMQATLVVLGNLFYLGVQCEHPMLLLLTGWLTAFVFINIVYALVASFGDVGKAIAVVLLVVQVAGSGGTFPIEMLTPIFQQVYPFLPFVPAIDAFHAASAGIWQGEFVSDLLHLAAFLIPALLLGLVLRKPVMKLNEWFGEQLESTKIM